MGSILKEYKKYQQELVKKYGEQSVVLLQVGSFYEIYGVENNFGKTVQVSKILNILQTLKNKSLPHSMQNPYLAGFPVHSLGKHLLKLINACYTVGEYNQFDDNHQKRKIRKLVNVYSKSTFLDDECDNNSCMGVYISEYKCPIQKKKKKECAIVIIDLPTGKTSLFSCANSIDFPTKVESEITRILKSMRPCEIVHNTKLFESSTEYVAHYREVKEKFSNIDYQKKFLKKLFKNYDIHDLGMDKYPDLITCYLFTLQFIHDHDPKIIRRLQKPEFLTSSKDVVLNNDALEQLHILNNGQKSLLDIIDFTKTKMGYRLLKSRLYYPCKDSTILNERYDQIDQMIKDDKYKEIQSKLQGIGDLEKKFRKLALLRLTPFELERLDFSFRKILQLDIPNQNKFSEFYQKYKLIFDFSLKSHFRESVDMETETKIKEIKQALKNIAKSISIGIDPDFPNLVKIEETEKYGFYLATTKKRWELYTKNHLDHPFNAKVMTSGIRITMDSFDNYWGDYKKLQNVLAEKVKKKYIKILETFHLEYNSVFNEIIQYLAEIDVYSSLAHSSIKYAYSRPVIVENNVLRATKIRHPLIERIHTDSEYVTNDIDVSSMLLYGVNAGGKSSLLRSIGTNVILAQMGSFVACERLEYTPFDHILTKIASMDNLHKGQSTFVYEMLELKKILTLANERSLVLCDELTAGTETFSAEGLVASALHMLLKKKIKFVFTTHLHGLIKYEDLIKQLTVYHFKIDIQPDNITYKYKLEKGSGDNIYGIEIAKALGLPREFIERALKFRMDTQILKNKRSRYNSRIIVDMCENCGTRENLHTHHINEQSKADSNGIINHFHKNMAHNLQILCRDCHIEHHSH